MYWYKKIVVIIIQLTNTILEIYVYIYIYLPIYKVLNFNKDTFKAIQIK